MSKEYTAIRWDGVEDIVSIDVIEDPIKTLVELGSIKNHKFLGGSEQLISEDLVLIVEGDMSDELITATDQVSKTDNTFWINSNLIGCLDSLGYLKDVADELEIKYRYRLTSNEFSLSQLMLSNLDTLGRVWHYLVDDDR